MASLEEPFEAPLFLRVQLVSMSIGFLKSVLSWNCWKLQPEQWNTLPKLHNFQSSVISNAQQHELIKIKKIRDLVESGTVERQYTVKKERKRCLNLKYSVPAALQF